MSLHDLRLDGVRMAVLDVDNTLVAGSTAFWFGLHLARQKQIPWTMLARGAWWAVQHRTGFIDVDTVMQSSAAHLRGKSRALIDEMIEESFDAYVRPRIFADARELVRRCHERGIETLLLSASGQPMVRRLALELDVPAHIGNVLEMDDDVATGRLLEPYAYGAGKLAFLERHLAGRSIALSECAGFADSRSDLPLLRALGAPHAVNADRALVREARARRWPILEFAR